MGLLGPGIGIDSAFCKSPVTTTNQVKRWKRKQPDFHVSTTFLKQRGVKLGLLEPDTREKPRCHANRNQPTLHAPIGQRTPMPALCGRVARPRAPAMGVVWPDVTTPFTLRVPRFAQSVPPVWRQTGHSAFCGTYPPRKRASSRDASRVVQKPLDHTSSPGGEGSSPPWLTPGAQRLHVRAASPRSNIRQNTFRDRSEERIPPQRGPAAEWLVQGFMDTGSKIPSAPWNLNVVTRNIGPDAQGRVFVTRHARHRNVEQAGLVALGPPRILRQPRKRAMCDLR